MLEFLNTSFAPLVLVKNNCGGDRGLSKRNTTVICWNLFVCQDVDFSVSQMSMHEFEESLILEAACLANDINVKQKCQSDGDSEASECNHRPAASVPQPRGESLMLI